jgi:multidrug efflux pump subunit AcrA (membrane-fusion protein)
MNYKRTAGSVSPATNHRRNSMGTKDRIPSDPDKRREYEEAKAKLEETEADRARAKARNAEDLKRRRTEEEEGVKHREQVKAEMQAERESQQAQRQAARKKMLKTPLTRAERKTLEKYEAKAQAQGVSNPNPVMMRELADLRTRAKVK